MTAQVKYLNRFLNASDEMLRAHYKMQDLINENKAKFWYDMDQLGINDYQKKLCYDRWVHSNRDRIKLVEVHG
jgi:hypothetical protein